MPPRGLHYGLLLSTLLLLGSCVPPSQPFYAGPILGDSVRIYPLPYPVNTPMHELFPTISRDWKWFYFGRRQNDTTWLYRTAIDSGHAPMISSAVERFLPDAATRVYFAAPGRGPREFIVVGCNLPDTRGGCDLYEMELDEGYRFESITNITAVNTGYWESTPMLNGSGDQLWFTQAVDAPFTARYSSVGELLPDQFDIMISIRGPEGWERAKSAGSRINTRFAETSPSLGFNDSVLFFISDREGGLGASDVYMSFRGEDGTWGRPQNLGPPINSRYDETSVCILPDNRHLLIASDRPGEGEPRGVDIYVVELRYVSSGEEVGD